jgi:hypothetical protein
VSFIELFTVFCIFIMLFDVIVPFCLRRHICKLCKGFRKTPSEHTPISLSALVKIKSGHLLVYDTYDLNMLYAFYLRRTEDEQWRCCHSCNCINRLSGGSTGRRLSGLKPPTLTEAPPRKPKAWGLDCTLPNGAENLCWQVGCNLGRSEDVNFTAALTAIYCFLDSFSAVK